MRKRNSQLGSILVLSALFAFMLFLVALALFKLVPSEFHHAKRSRNDVLAHYAAEAGVKNAVAWLEEQPLIKALPQSVLDQEYNAVYNSGPIEIGPDWGYTARLGVNPSGSRYYDITARAYFRGREIREARVTVQRQSFARYALFIDTWPENMVYGLGEEGIRGPFHTNDFFRLTVPDGDYWTAGTEPFVSGELGVMTHSRKFGDGTLPYSGDGNAYYGGNAYGQNDELVPYNEDGSVEGRYERIVRGGRGNLQVVQDVLLPPNVGDLQKKAWDEDASGTITLPSEPGVFVNSNGGAVEGGIFVQGDVELNLTVDEAGNQVHELTQETFDTAYMTMQEIEMEVPVYEYQTVTGLVEEVIEQTCTRVVMVIVGYEERWVPVGNGINEVIQVPIYEEEIQEYTCYVPTGRMIEATQPVLVQVGTEIQTVQEPRIISEEEYLADPEAYPDASQFFQPGGEDTARVVEVTEDGGFTIPAGSVVDGAPSSAPIHVDAGNTVVQDFEGEYAVLTGVLNGVTFVNGNLDSLQGLSKGAAGTNQFGEEGFTGRMIAANTAWDRKINITGDLLQFYNGDDEDRRDPSTPFALKRGELSPNADHVLGVVGGEVHLRPPNKAGVLDIYGVILAGRTVVGPNGDPVYDGQGKPVTRGGFGVHEDLRTGGGAGDFKLVGGVIEAEAFPWLSSGNGLKGQLIYDQAAAHGLDNFPMTQDFVVLRFVETRSDRG